MPRGCDDDGMAIPWAVGADESAARRVGPACGCPAVGGRSRWRSASALETLLAIIWCIYVVQLVATVRAHPASEGRNAILAVDLLAVLVPLAAFVVGTNPRDISLACGVWILKPLRIRPPSAWWQRFWPTRRQPDRRRVHFRHLLFVAAVVAHLVERDAQPDAFGSIGKAMWWAVVTLSTTGYGDAIPQSLAGRVLAGLVMMSGIGVFALWAGILATGFAEEVRRLDFVNKWQLVSVVPLFRQLGAPNSPQ